MWLGCAQGVRSEMEGRIGAVTDRNPSESGGSRMWSVAAYLERDLTEASEGFRSSHSLDGPPGFASDGSGHGIGCRVGGVLAQYPEARSDAMILLVQ